VADFRLGQAAELLGVSVDTVRRWADGGRLPVHRSDGGHRMVDGAELARFLTDTVAVAESESAVAHSARNRFPGIVTRVVRDSVMAQVEIRSGPNRIVSLISREAADELGLAPGVLAVASVKSTNMGVELAGPR
jgi:molybdopterin-binding protein